jgi:DNA-binding response OmpR family regulator
VAEILVVEDDSTLGMTLEMSLSAHGHGVRLCRGLETARQAVRTLAPDLVILDLGLPDGEGMDLCRDLRRTGSKVPILILTARESLGERIEGLELGADDYITKPFELPELLARVEAFLRRQHWHGSGGKVRIGRLFVDFELREATRDGDPIELTDLELRLLRHLMEQEGRAVLRQELLTDVWGLPASTRTRTVDVFIGRLRRYVEEDPARPRHLLNVRGVGYRLVRRESEVDEGRGGGAAPR